MIQYLFLVKNPSFDSRQHRREFATEQFSAVFIGVSSVADACQVVTSLDTQDMIDLCSGFSGEDAQRVFEAAGKKTKVCYAGICCR